MSCSAIIYALFPAQISKLHRLCCDEMWHHYSGPSVEVIELDSTVAGHVRKTVLGKNFANFNQLQHVVKAGTWFGARALVVAEGASCTPAVLGCTVTPSFDFADFTMGDREQLLRLCVFSNCFCIE
jgi:predicted cupin superfamily sugar epimerase